MNSALFGASQRNVRLAFAFILLTYLSLAIGMSLTKAPICDEGWYADPAMNLVTNGSMGSPVIESAGTFLKGIDRYTYWEMPGHIVVQAGWYEIFGRSLFTTRTLSVFAGLAALICWYFVILRLRNDTGVALLAMALAAIDTIFIAQSATGRSDMLSLAFGAAAQLSYVTLREKHLGVASLCAHTFVVASGLTHPNGGLVSLCLVIVLQVYLDRHRFNVRHVLLAMVPYFAGALAWGAYIAKDPSIFAAQFQGNSADRLWPLTSPLLALKREIAERFLGGYRMGSSSWTPLASSRLLILAAYLAGVCTTAYVSELRKSRLVGIVLLQTCTTFLILLFFEGAKQPWYLIYLVWPFTVLLAVSLKWFWHNWAAWRSVLALSAAALVCIELGYPLLVIWANRYRNSYLPAVAVVASRVTENRSVMASAEFGFGLGFQKVLDDRYLGYYTGKQPAFIILDPRYRAVLDHMGGERPEAYKSTRFLLEHKYQQLYSNGAYTVMARIDKGPEKVALSKP